MNAGCNAVHVIVGALRVRLTDCRVPLCRLRIGCAAVVQMSDKPNSNEPQPKLYDLAESAIQNLLRDNPALTRAEVVEMLDAFGFLDKRFFIPQ